MKKILLVIITLFCLGCAKEVEVKATILDHTVTSNRYGDRTYITIVRTEDGYIRELTGLKYYTIPEGNKINIKVYR
jgi:hypothetical protein